ncbi:hypothetical protein HHK36_006625 [Tetracentron sinense]|uniref:Nucleotide-diphospho-sugar transferase domain-containing protein n=1 Tax=Tetracentron sinense TaxID=13715 RepID=A0A835DL49_TETSI|nr:hypothetical protein HHK36_006625 [Tetracentron sinense]
MIGYKAEKGSESGAFLALILGATALSCVVLYNYKDVYPFQLLPRSSRFNDDVSSFHTNASSDSVELMRLEKVLKKAAMEDRTVILTTLNEAWTSPDSIFDLFLESFQIGDHTRRLLDHLVVIALDQKAYARCMTIHNHCFSLVTEGVNFSREAYYMNPEYLKMMWRRTDFLRTVLEMGYNFIFTDSDIMWLRDPFPRFYVDADFQIACDHFEGNSYDMGNMPNGGFKYVKSNNRSIEFYKFWYLSRETYPGKNEQDVLNMIKNDKFITDIGLKMRFLDTAYFDYDGGPSNGESSKEQYNSEISQILSSMASFTISLVAQISSMVTAKLIEKNYLAWKDQILPMIENVDLLNHIADEVKELKQQIISDGKEEINLVYVQWRKDDQLLKSLISGTSTEEVHAFVIGLKTARKIWLCLAENFAGGSQERELGLTANSKQFAKVIKDEKIPQALAAMSITDPHDPEWIPDIGATSHMTNNPREQVTLLTFSEYMNFVPSPNVLAHANPEPTVLSDRVAHNSTDCATEPCVDPNASASVMLPLSPTDRAPYVGLPLVPRDWGTHNFPDCATEPIVDLNALAPVFSPSTPKDGAPYVRLPLVFTDRGTPGEPIVLSIDTTLSPLASTTDEVQTDPDQLLGPLPTSQLKEHSVSTTSAIPFSSFYSLEGNSPLISGP